MIIPLSKPFVYEDYDLKEIELDFEGATADILERADRHMTRIKHVPQMKWQDTVYCMKVASLLSGIPDDVLKKLPLRDGNLLVNTISSFLLNSAEPETGTED
jgi:hypothetical protein